MRRHQAILALTRRLCDVYYALMRAGCFYEDKVLSEYSLRWGPAVVLSGANRRIGV